MLKWFIPTIIAILAGFFVLLGFLVPVQELALLRIILVRWATVLAAFALLLAYFNLLRVHLDRLLHQGKQRLSSLLLILASLVSLVLVAWQGPDGEWTRWMMQNILVPGESALLALTAVTLLLSGMQIYRVRREAASILFILVAILALWRAVPYLYPPLLAGAMRLLDGIAVGGMRGLLLGVVLGITVTGLRVIFGIDRPYTNE